MTRLPLLLASTLFVLLPSCSEEAESSSPRSPSARERKLAGQYTADIDRMVAEIMSTPEMNAVSERERQEAEEKLRSSLGSFVLNLNDDLNYDVSIAFGYALSTRVTHRGTWEIDGEKLILNHTHMNGEEVPYTSTATLTPEGITIPRDEGRVMFHVLKKPL